MVALAPIRRPNVALISRGIFRSSRGPRPFVISGPVNVSIKEWTVPTLGSRPHDPEPGPGAPSGGPACSPTCWGGSIPQTGELKEYPAEDTGLRAHGSRSNQNG